MNSILEIKGNSLRIEGTVLIISKINTIPIILETAGDDFLNICIVIGSVSATVTRLGIPFENEDPPEGITYTWELISPEEDDTFILTNTDKRTVNFEIQFKNFIDRTLRFYTNKDQEDEQFDDITITATPSTYYRNLNTGVGTTGYMSSIAVAVPFISKKQYTDQANSFNTGVGTTGYMSSIAVTVPFISKKQYTDQANSFNTGVGNIPAFSAHSTSIVLRRIGATTTGVQGQANNVCLVTSWDLEWYHPSNAREITTNIASRKLSDYDLVDRWVVEEQTNGSNTWTQVFVKYPNTNPLETDLTYSATSADKKYRVIAHYKNLQYNRKEARYIELSGPSKFTYKVSNYVITPSDGYIFMQGKSAEFADMINNINTGVGTTGYISSIAVDVPTNPTIGG
jgi:hypothetical protein